MGQISSQLLLKTQLTSDTTSNILLIESLLKSPEPQSWLLRLETGNTMKSIHAESSPLVTPPSLINSHSNVWLPGSTEKLSKDQFTSPAHLSTSIPSIEKDK